MADGSDEASPPQVPAAICRTPDGATHRVHPGGLVGRLASAALRIEDPRISEAHALLSLRGAQLRLLGLRGAVRSGTAAWTGEVDVQAGGTIELAEGVAIEVESVELPERMMALEGPAGRQVLDRPEWSVVGPPVTIRPGVEPEAAVWIWCTAEQWWMRGTETEPRRLVEGDRFTVGGDAIEVVIVDVASASVPRTVRSDRSFPPLDVQIWPEHSQIEVGDRRVRITGRRHQILRETARMMQRQGSAHWTEVAKRIWRVNPTEDNWQRTRGRLIQWLKSERLPAGLLAQNGGQVYLSLRDGVDRIVLHDDTRATDSAEPGREP